MDWLQNLTRDMLRQLAGSRSFSDGEIYAAQGMVSHLLADEHTIVANVQGTQRYQVRLKADSAGKLVGQCSCPYGVEGNFCKHCVAVGLAWLRASVHPTGAVDRSAAEKIREYLNGLSQAQLVELVLEQVGKYDDLEDALLRKSAMTAAQGPDLDIYRASIDRAIETDSYIEYEHVWDYVSGVYDVTESLNELLDSGFAAEARSLVEYALDRLAESMNLVDDSSGNVGGAWQTLNKLHVQATLQAPGDPIDLAEWLFQREIARDWDIDTVWQDYLPALGMDGEAHFRRVVEDAWLKIPVLKPGQSDSGKRYRMTNLMRSLLAKDDFAGLIALEMRDLSSPYRYLHIAELCSQHGDADDAVRWAEDGIEHSVDKSDSRLVEFLATQYIALERFPDAYQILWKWFKEKPDLQSYQRLHDLATDRGDWGAWRARCWDILNEDARRKQSERLKSQQRFAASYDRSLFVSILLWEQRPEEAWQEAQAGGCSLDLWLKLAETRETSHPEDAVRIYRDQVMRQLQTASSNYNAPVQTLQKIRRVLRQAGQEEQLTVLIRQFRAQYKLKRNFIKALDAAGFPA